MNYVIVGEHGLMNMVLNRRLLTCDTIGSIEFITYFNS